MKDLIIVCEDSFGLDVKSVVIAINDYWKKQRWGTPYRIKGFIGNGNTADSIKHELSPFLGTIEEWVPSEDEFFAMGIAEPHSKKRAVEIMKARGARFETLWAPWVLANLDSQFAEGCIIAAQSVMDSARIGSYVTLFHSMVGFDAVVEDYSTIKAFSNITTSYIGECTLIDNNCVVFNNRVNRDAVVMPNSVVVKEVKTGSTVTGNPAKRLK